MGPFFEKNALEKQKDISNISFNEVSNAPIINVRARVAIYDDLFSAPRVLEIEPMPINEYIEALASKTYELAQNCGGSIPYTVIREVTENFIHANFKEIVVSILDKGNTISFADQGPGIAEKQKVQLPGYTSATSEMKQYIRGVGSGLPIVKEYLSFTGGRLKIEDNVKDGTVVTITLRHDANESLSIPSFAGLHEQQPIPMKPSPAQRRISDRENQIMRLFLEYGAIGQSDIKKSLGISLATATRTLESLEEAGYIMTNSSKKRVLTEEGFSYLRSLNSR